MQSSASNSLPPAKTDPPTASPKTAGTLTESPTAAPPKPTFAPTEAPTKAPTDAPTAATPVEDETTPQFTEPTDTTEDEVVVETTANGGGVAIPLLSVLGVVGIASLVVARRAYLKNKDDAESTSSDSEQT